METKASHILVGSFVLLGVVTLFAFVAWLAKVEIDQETAFYEIYFEGSVSGLTLAGDVRYRGINVGSVKEIGIDPEDPTKVRVLVEIDTAVPIREGDVASLEFQGITGVSYINISGGETGNPILEPAPGRPYPVIPSRPSQFEKLFKGAPDLIASGKVLTDRAAELLNEENRRQISEILNNLKQLMESLGSRRAEIERTIDALDKGSADFVAAARAVRQVAERSEGLIDEIEVTLSVARGTLAGVDNLVGREGAAAVAEFRETMRAINDLAREFEGAIAENREPLRHFTGDGLGELKRFLTEARQLVANMSRLSERIESDPAALLFGTRDAEFKAD